MTITPDKQQATSGGRTPLTPPAASPRPGKGRPVELVVDLYTGPMFRAALALWVASAAEPELAAQVMPLEVRIGRQVHRLVVELLGADETEPGVRESIQATLDLARGLGLANLLTDDSARRRPIVDQWATMLDAALGIR